MEVLMKRGLAMLTAVGLLAAAGSAVVARGPATQVSSALRYEEIVRADPVEHLHILRVDLSDPLVTLHVALGGDDPDGVGPWQTVLQKPTEICRREGLDAAVNGNMFAPKDGRIVLGRMVPYFVGNWTIMSGRCMSDGKLVSNAAAPASLVVDDAGRVRIGRFDAVPAGARQIVSGPQMLLQGGHIVAPETKVTPGTAAGIDAGGRELVLLVVDGRRADYSVGMTARERAAELLRLGCGDALDLDGGGSSAMVLDSTVAGWPAPATTRATTRPATQAADDLRVVNLPSDGHDFWVPLSVERPVACVLGIRLKR